MKLYYNSKNTLGKQTYAYVQSIKRPLLGIDTAKDNITGTQWSEIAEGLNIEIAELIDKSHPDFKTEYGNAKTELDEYGWLKVLQENPQLVRRPILLKGNSFHFIETPSAVVKFIEPDSSGLEKPYNK
ncbi:MAG: hypothetical protein HKP38_08085 [Croceitalea sp.]|nr:hypothetical protein [Croceitalea sp.]